MNNRFGMEEKKKMEPRKKTEGAGSPLSLKKIQITDSFWEREMELVRTEVIPYQWEALNDRIEGAEPSYCMRNFKIAGKRNRERIAAGAAYQKPEETFRGFQSLPENKEELEDTFYGFLFQDSDFFKWIEAVGYSLSRHQDPALEAIADEAIDLVCEAQLENGYLDTYYIINGQDQIFTNLRDNHELYCMGHLIEGAVAYYEATGKDKLLRAAERYADFAADYFGAEEGKCKGYPGHEIAEMALLRLYETTGNEKYRRLAAFFIEERGKQPYYFDSEQGGRVRPGTPGLRYAYHQAHLPVREQEAATGHAVRAVYLYSGMADLARISRDPSLQAACQRLWDNVTGKQMYVTGGVGSTKEGEAFTFDYDLPNDLAYAETCASIGLVFWARRMLQLKADSRYADVMERALYNGVLAGMALDGKRFFYVNPLEVWPESCRKDERKQHVKTQRQKWFGCACCPPNIARLLSSIASYAYTETEDTLYVHLYMGSVLEKKIGDHTADIRITSGFPFSGRVSVEVRTETAQPFAIAFRIPDWCGGQFQLEKEAAGTAEVRDGYLYVCRNWSENSCLELEFPMEVHILEANPAVREDIGKICLQRGPLVYCMEEIDNGKDLHLIRMAKAGEPVVEEMTIQGFPMLCIKTRGEKRTVIPDSGLYRRYEPAAYEEKELCWIPYFAWNNRGEGEMSVWIRER